MTRYVCILIGGRAIHGHLVEANSDVIELHDDHGIHHIIQRDRIEELVSVHGLVEEDDDDDDDGGDDDEDEFDPFDPDNMIITWVTKRKTDE